MTARVTPAIRLMAPVGAVGLARPGSVLRPVGATVIRQTAQVGPGRLGVRIGGGYGGWVPLGCRRGLVPLARRRGSVPSGARRGSAPLGWRHHSLLGGW